MSQIISELFRSLKELYNYFHNNFSDTELILAAELKTLK